MSVRWVTTLAKVAQCCSHHEMITWVSGVVSKRLNSILCFFISIGFTNALEFSEGFFIVKGILFKAPWIRGAVVLGEHCLIVKCLNVHTPHVVIAHAMSSYHHIEVHVA